jgi:RNA polymerase sigma-70 factor (ECF subfamily)
LSSWIYAITRNRCLTALERRRPLDSLDEMGDEADWASTQTGEPADGREEQLLALVRLLPERLRHTLVLYYYEERSVSEVALMLGCPQGTVKTLLFRARAALAQMLKRRGWDDPAYWQEGAS